MVYRIDDKGRLIANGRTVSRKISRYTSGKFSKTPKITVVHFTYGGSALSTANWFDDPANPYKSSAHIIVGRDGELIQCVDLDTVANHAGKSFWRGTSGLNDTSFGIELSNWGYLQKLGATWTSWTGQAVSNPIEAVHRNGNPNHIPGPVGWEPYTAVQIRTAAAVVRAIADHYGKQEVIGHDDISVGRKWDPGPAFDMSHFRQLSMENYSDSSPGLLQVRTPDDTLNMRRGPGIEFEKYVELPDGTLLQPLEYKNQWVLVNVLGDNMAAKKTGWVNSRHLAEA